MMVSLRARLQVLSTLSVAALLITVAHSAFVAVPSNMAAAASTECADGIDNDFDGLIDYPEDGQCLSLHDNSEGPTGKGLFLSVTDGLEDVDVGGHVTYTITLQTDRLEPKEVDVHFFIPHQTNLISASDGGDLAGDYIVWRKVTVYPRQPRKLFVNVNVTPYALNDLLIIAEVVSEGEKATDTTRVREDDIVNGNRALKLAVTDGKAYAEPAEELHYKITVRNATGPARKYTLRTELPPFVEFIAGSNNPDVQGRSVEWYNQEIFERETLEYYLAVKVNRDVPKDYVVRLRVATNDAVASDATSIHLGVLNNAFDVIVDDGREFAAIGDNVTYSVTIRNHSSKLATEVDMNNALSQYMEFVSATEGGQWTGTNVRWTGLTVSPDGQRTLHVTGRVRSDAPLGAQLRNSASVRGVTAVDITTVARQGDKGMSANPVLLRKNADRSEVRPGDSVNYTIYLRNTTDRAFTNVVVTDRFDGRAMRVVGGQSGELSNGQLQWHIPQLLPGEEWTAHYTMQVSASVPHGVVLNNVASVSGDGLAPFSLTERVYTGSLGVVSDLPPTGAAFDALFLFLSALLGLGGAVAQRRSLLA